VSIIYIYTWRATIFYVCLFSLRSRWLLRKYIWKFYNRASLFYNPILQFNHLGFPLIFTLPSILYLRTFYIIFAAFICFRTRIKRERVQNDFHRTKVSNVIRRGNMQFSHLVRVLQKYLVLFAFNCTSPW